MRLKKLIEKWRKTAMDHMDAGDSYKADPYYKCANELEAEFPAIEQETRAQVEVMLRKAANLVDDYEEDFDRRQLVEEILALVPVDSQKALDDLIAENVVAESAEIWEKCAESLGKIFDEIGKVSDLPIPDGACANEDQRGGFRAGVRFTLNAVFKIFRNAANRAAAGKRGENA